MRRWLLGLFGRYYVRLLVDEVEAAGIERAGDVANPWPRREIARLVHRELDAIPESVIAHFDYQDREVRILSDRLTRRYDLGMALNEAAARAIDAKKAQLGASYPTPKQQMALDVQAQTLQQRLKDTR